MTEYLLHRRGNNQKIIVKSRFSLNSFRERYNFPRLIPHFFLLSFRVVITFNA